MVEVESAPVVVDVPVTVPIEGLIESEVALAVFQFNTDVPFNAMVAGDAENEEIVGSTPFCVVAETMLDGAETFPTLSCAVTS